MRCTVLRYTYLMLRYAQLSVRLTCTPMARFAEPNRTEKRLGAVRIGATSDDKLEIHSDN